MQLLRWKQEAKVGVAARRSCAFLKPSPAKLEDRTQLAGIAQYSRVDHTKRFLPSYIPRRACSDQSRTPHLGRYRSANGGASQCPSVPRADMAWTPWSGRHDLRHLKPSWCLQLPRPVEAVAVWWSRVHIDCLYEIIRLLRATMLLS